MNKQASPQLPSFSREDILSLVGTALFERGLDYYQRGMLEEFDGHDRYAMLAQGQAI